MTSSRTAKAAGGHLARGLARAFGGALLFALPVLMTMETWALGFHVDRLRLVLLMVLNVPLLTFISHYSGFEDTFDWREDLRDAAIACGVAFVASAVVLSLFGVLRASTPLSEVVGTLGVQSVPASLGALLARSQLGGGAPPAQEERREPYGGELALMAVGALFLGLNVAPTEEMLLISYRMTFAHGVALAVFSLAVMHAFVYAAAFKGGSELTPDTPWWSAFARFTVVGYALALGISAYLLWTFGALEGHEPGRALMATVVLAFPASVGAAAARLIL